MTIKSAIYDLLVSRRYDAELETVTEDARRRCVEMLAPRPGGRCAMMDTYWPKPPHRLWLMSWSYAADPKRPGFELLRATCDDFSLEHFPPDVEHGFYLASGTKR